VRLFAVRVTSSKAANSSAEAPVKSLSLSDKPSIAVLPFQNMSGDPEQEYFADGLAEDIITELSRFREFAVIACNSTFFYKGKPINVAQVAQDLKVRYVLEGSARSGQDEYARLRQTISVGGSSASEDTEVTVMPLMSSPMTLTAPTR
jgi:adenylate cyclase